ncbi:hypothetical protein LINPERHAP1_LOCUS10837 [Linum perenne]
MAATRTERSKPPLHNFNLPCLKWGNQKPENRTAKLSVSLSRKEIETDFMAMLGRRPARRPRKRPRIVQKQIDALSVGFWLREVNLDTYKVEEEIANTGKVNFSFPDLRKRKRDLGVVGWVWVGLMERVD